MSEGSIWTRTRAAASTGRPAQRGRGDIAAAAIMVAEVDGLSAVTMRRVARELGTGAASLYRHLATHDDLLDLMIDQALRDYTSPPITGDPIEDMVADLIARLQFVRERPWLIEAIDLRPTISPERIRLIELSLERLAPHPADGPTKLAALSVLAGMVHTQSRHEREGGALTPEAAQAQLGLLQQIAGDGDHPHLAKAMAESPPAPLDVPDAYFAGVLRRVLNGLLTAHM